VAVFNIFALSLLLAFPSSTAHSIERAFLENSPRMLRSLLTASGNVPLSLPDPLSCADQVSPGQAYFLFERIFTDFRTTEFFVDPRLSTLLDRPGGILNARWSLRNLRTGTQYPFRVFFYLIPEKAGPDGTPPLVGGPVFKIAEIRAERL